MRFNQSPVTPADEQFLAAFEAGQIANQNFHHRDHLRLAWIQVRRLGLDRASDAVESQPANLDPEIGRAHV